MEEKGILTGKLESSLAKDLDDAIELKGIWEALDGVGFKITISAVDNNLADKIPEPYKTELRELLTEVLEEKDYMAAAEKAAIFVDGLIDIPGLDDPTERMIFVGIFTAVAGLFAKKNTDDA